MISSTGVGSGLDVNSIVTSLMAIERRPLQLLQQRASTIQTKISAFGALQSQISNLGDVANRLAVPSNFAQTTATSSVPASVAVTAGTGAATGNFSVQREPARPGPFAGQQCLHALGRGRDWDGKTLDFRGQRHAD